LRETLPGGEFPTVRPVHRKIMQAVRGKGNSTTEARFRAALAKAGISGWRANCKLVSGSPDIFFPNARLAIFLDGCFWHGCDLCGHTPKKNSQFWGSKITRNKERDKRTTALLRRKGISVVRFWEHDILNSLQDCLMRTKQILESRETAGTKARKA